ncbi:MAG TPA: spermidine/putrescine ABC transporter substrate-binding protein [Solirubrobacteraceae bacterium]|jgi:spermidine/putrescine transport system substrate-binding protein|nr:spermidine/putrescine ABC transporter substrate-binding protein [Solirubrobacteraceae bacterium]
MAGAGLALGGMLAGCSATNPAAGSGIPPLPRQDKPVKWPVYSQNKPIASGLAPEEGATLQLYNWVAYINEAVVKSFCKKHNCKYSLTTFNTMEEALAKLSSGELKVDVFFPTVAVLGQLIAAKLVRPLNHTYIPNMANAWPDYHNPFYDQDWQYTTPYSIYTSGMAWRKDKVNLAPSWNMPWQGAPYKGKVAVLDDYRETISLALLRAGNLDLNTTSTPQIRAAGKALQNLATLTNVRIDNNDYTDVPTGKTWIHHAWSGDMATSYQYLPKGTSIDTLGYWFPADKKGPVANDLMVNATGGANPVLAHKFIDYMLDVDNALNNYSYVGYMQPLSEVTPGRLITEKLLPRQLTSTVVLPQYFRNGLFQLELPPAADAVWESTWNSFSNGL